MPASVPRCRSISPTGIVARSSPGDCSNRRAPLSTPTRRANKPPSIRGCHRAWSPSPQCLTPRSFVRSGFYEVALTAGTPTGPRHTTLQNLQDSLSVQCVTHAPHRGVVRRPRRYLSRRNDGVAANARRAAEQSTRIRDFRCREVSLATAAARPLDDLRGA